MSTVRIQVRRGTAADWTSVNPILAAGEMGVESDTNLFKFGNGTNTWSALAYANKNNAEVIEIAQDAIDAALSLGAGLTKSYNDGANTITISVDSDVIALKSYVDGQITGLSNTADNTYIPISDRGSANGVAALDSNTLVPNSQIDANYWASKVHVASVSSGLVLKAASRVATTENLSVSRNAGSSDASGGNGVGETLTLSSNGALSIDGISLSANDRVLVKNQTDAKQNGIYVVTNAGSSGAAAVLTRAIDADNSVDGEVKEGLFTFVAEGTNNARNGYVLLANASRSGEIFQLGTDNLEFSQFTGAIPLNVGNGLSKIGNSVEIDPSVVASVTQVTNVESSVTTLTNSVDQRVTLVEADVSQNGSDIVNLQTSLNTAQQDINGLRSDLTVSQTDISGIDTRLTAAEADIQGLDGRVTTAEQLLITHTTDIADINTLNTAQSTRLDNLEAADVNFAAEYAQLNGPTFTGTVVLPSTTSIGNISDTEIGYLNGVTSDIQIQLDAKAAASSLTSHENSTTNVHGISDTSVLETQTGAQNKADAAQAAAEATAAADATTKANNAESDAITAAATAAAALYATIVDTTITGDATAENLTLSGNLIVNGTTTTVSSTNLEVTDPLIYIGTGNSANTKDLGLVGHFDNGTYQHTGIVRDATDGKWKLFSGITTEPSDVIDFSSPTYDTLRLGAVEFSDGTQTKEGVPSQTTISSKTADYTLNSLSERDSMIEVNSSSSVTVTVPPNSSVAYPVGTSIDLLRVGSGAVTIAAGSGVTLNYTPGNKLRAQWSSATLFKRATDTWVLVGDLSA